MAGAAFPERALEQQPETQPQRLSRIVAAIAACSRSQAEQYIVEGWVRVDGKVVDVPQERVRPGQRVELAPNARLQAAGPATLLVHKPAGMHGAQALASVGAATHWSGDASGIRRIKSHGVGQVELLPLPPPASGLAVFSQDGRIVRKLTEDALLVEQELVVEVTGTIVPNGLERLGRGFVLEGRTVPPARVSWQSEARLRFAAKGIAPDRVPAICAHVGLTVTAIRRLRIGRVALAGLPPGQWRYLAPAERF
ncbi:RNA-binding protein [Ramlibacter ginsenosidimutans]|uniref:Dual-specificity RNA pseudouridine synthase RluF n=1 Tax=Ramlibacter ginsenosidimutans TaxID=502333 RepID=A0A934WM60_9BURK|nr:RNA-binding protein [Ramlibacter ginsenosidimutans]